MAKKSSAKRAARRTPKPDMQSGMEGSEPAATKDRKTAVEAQFAEADAKGDAKDAEQEAIRVGQQIRGY